MGPGGRGPAGKVAPQGSDPVRLPPVRLDPVRLDPVRLDPVRLDAVRFDPVVFTMEACEAEITSGARRQESTIQLVTARDKPNGASRPLRRRRGAHALVLALALITVPAAAAEREATPRPGGDHQSLASRPCRPATAGERFRVDFDGVELGILARLVACAAELDLMFAHQVLAGRQLSVVAPRPVSVKDLVALFVRSLHTQGLVLERHGRYGVIRLAADGGGDGGDAAQPAPKRRSSKGR